MLEMDWGTEVSQVDEADAVTAAGRTVHEEQHGQVSR